MARVEEKHPGSQAIWNEAYLRAKAGLSQLAPNAAEGIARKLADAVVKFYTQELDRGSPPGQAQTVAYGWADSWIADAQKANGITPPAPTSNLVPGQNPGSVNAGDVKQGTDVYRDAITDGRPILERIRDKTGVPDPSAVKFFEDNRVTPQNIHASTVTGPGQIDAVKQEGTTVEGTDLTDLQAAAKGQGSAQQLANARYLEMLQRQGQTTNASIQSARGAERKGLRRAQTLAAGEQALQAGSQIAQQDAATALQAQQQVAQFDARRKELQAQLESARKDGDANREQQVNNKMADLENDVKKFNADQTQRAAGTNASNKLTGDTTNLQTGLKSIEQDFNTWKQTNELALQAQKALEQSAQGLLNEDQRQQILSMARAQFEQAKKEFEALQARADKAEERARAEQRMQFWGTMITSLVGLGVTAATGNPAAGAAAGSTAGALVPKANPFAHGGAVDRTTLALIGEEGDHEIVIPLKGKLSDRMLSLLSSEAKPFDPAGPSGQIDNMDDLTRAIRATLKTAPVDDDMTSMLASATLRSRSSR
jgi:hypothetical protein